MTENGSHLVLSVNPRTGQVARSYPATTLEEVQSLAHRASAAARIISAAEPSRRAEWLAAIATALNTESVRRDLTTIAESETALGEDRLAAEYDRLIDQIRFYASVVREGSFLDVTIDSAGDQDLRSVNVPRGPVGVFAASNFPFCFGPLGHDTVTAIGAGCPVIVKAHPAQPTLSQKLIQVAVTALAGVTAPPHLLAMVQGLEAGEALVDEPAIAAIAFTGSGQGGQALWRRALRRPTPIPVFAEMGAVNPAIVLASAAPRMAKIFNELVSALTYGTGQVCTKPGLVLIPSGGGWKEAFAQGMARVPSGFGLTRAIAQSADRGIARLAGSGFEELAVVPGASSPFALTPTLFEARLDQLRPGSPALEECFGPVVIVAQYDDVDQALGLLSTLPGALAGSVFGDCEDALLPRCVDQISRTTGRVVVNQWTPGVSTAWAQHHGGPWPATTDSAATSVGARALMRFLRPVAYQNVPESALPDPLREHNPWRAPRRVDGRAVPVQESA